MSPYSSKQDAQQDALGSHTEEQFDKLVDVISRSQQNYRELIDNLDHAVFTLSLDGEIRVANRRLSEVLDVSFQNLIGRRLTEFIELPAPTEPERWLPVLLKNGSWTGTVPLRLKKDNELRYFHCWLQAVEEAGQATSISGWARDITLERESATRFATLFETLRDGVFFTSPEGKVLDANPALVRMLGFESKEELQSHSFREVYADPSQREALVREVAEKGAIHNREVVLRRKDGQEIHCLDTCTVIRDDTGRVLRFQGTFVDVTERREMEKRLHLEQEFVRHLIASFPDMIAVLDLEGCFTYASPRTQDVLGRPPQGFIGDSLGGQVHPDDSAAVKSMFAKVASGQATGEQFEYRVRHADGSWRILRANAGPLFDASGRISGVVASARDVTEAKKAEQQVAQKEKLAAMGEMMAGVAHELNNPLTAILGISDLLSERALDDTMHRQVETVLKQARRAAAIVQNLLVFSRPSALRQSKVRLDQIVKQALTPHRNSLQQKNITVEFEEPRDLAIVEGDAKLLVQVFSNLIANAEQAIVGARDHGTLRISIVHAGGKLSVCFVDDGCGIAPENIARIFDPFFTTKRPGGGTGLGLTISLAITKEHGGKIDVESNLGAGSTFRVVLPAVAEESSVVPAAPRGGVPAPSGSTELRGHSVFVVDDEESIREIVQEGLSARGMVVEGASNAEEALAHLSERRYEIVLCDFNMPGLNGEKFFERVRAQAGPATPRFVFMTGALLDSATIAEFSLRGASVLQKPFHIAALAELLTSLVQTQPAQTK
jgi:PAS domain S-box-containing protein